MRDFVAAQIALLRASARLKRDPIGTLTTRDPSASEGPVGSPIRARKLAAAVTSAAAYGLFRPRCLVRVLALQDLLARNGITGGDIRVGVRNRDGAFAAHAWVRWGNEILGDDPAHVATFREVDDIRVLAGQ